MSTDTPPATTRGVGSNWWYWVAAVPLYYVLATAAGVAFAVLAVGAALTGAAFDPSGVAVGFGFLGVFGVVLVLLAAGTLLSLAFPVAIYLDAEAVAAAAERGDAVPGWRPDPALYGLLGLVGIVAQPLQAPLGVYYLYRRHEAVGRP